MRASYADEMIAHAMFLVVHLHVQRVACLYQNDTFGLGGYVGIVNALASVGMRPRAAVDLESSLSVHFFYIALWVLSGRG